MSRYKLHSRGLTYTVKKVTDFSVPSRDVTDKTLPGGENLIIPGQRKFAQ